MEASGSALREQGLQALRAGDIDLAIDLLARAATLDPANAEANALLGVAYSQRSRHVEAIRALENAISRQPAAANFRFNLGIAQERAGDLPRAAQAFRETLRLDPAHAAARAKLQAMGEPVPAPAAAAPPATAPPPPAPPSFDAPPPAADAPFAAAPPPFTPGATPGSEQGATTGAYRDVPPPPPPPAYGPSLYQHTPSYAPGYPLVPGYGYASPSMEVGEAFLRRLGAAFIDGALCFGVCYALVMAVIFAFGLSAGGSSPGDALAGSFLVGSIGFLYLGGLVILPVRAVYEGTMVATRGQSLGQKALGVRLIGPDGGTPGFWRVFCRTLFGRWLSSSLCCLGYLWMLWDPEQQTWHDKIFSTHVVRA